MKNNIEKSEKIANTIVDIMCDNELSEENEFKHWCQTNCYAKETISRLADEGQLKEEVANFHQEEKFLLADKMVKSMIKRERRRNILRISSVAAAMIAIFFIVYNMMEKNVEKQNMVVAELQKEEKESDRPIIRTTEGTEIDLLGRSDAIINGKNNLNIDNVSKIINNMSSLMDSTVKYNQIIVPKLYTTKLTLDDGTIVHLNANSELKFPTKFAGESRNVELKGEAFFEVAKSDRRFVVMVNGTDIKVYGTKFNVRARRESSIETILISGSVGVKASGMSEVMMKPNQRLEIDHVTKKYQLENVDCQQYIGWVNGLFFFDNILMKDVIEELEIWYGIKINSSPNIDQLIINFSINRDNKFEDIILFMEKITGVKFIKERENVYSLK